MPFYLAAALAGVAVVGVAFIVVIELAEWHQREEERRLMQWTAERRGSAGSGGAVREQEQREARSSAWEEGEKKDGMRRRGQRAAVLEQDPFRLTDSDIDLPPSPSTPVASLDLDEKPRQPFAEAPHLTRSSSLNSSSTDTHALISNEFSSTISTPTLVSRPVSPSPAPGRVSPNLSQGGWDLLDEKIGAARVGTGSSGGSDDGWEALEESVDWGKASEGTVSKKAVPRVPVAAEGKLF